MADTHISAFECEVYGKLAAEEMRERVMPLHEAWSAAIARCIHLQDAATARVSALLARLGAPKVNDEEVAEVADTVVRFGAWIDSLKGHPLDAFVFFNGAPPSSVGRRRLPKLTGAIAHMIERLTPYTVGEDAVPGAAGRLAELQAAHAIAERNRDAQADAEALRVQHTPDLVAAREAWLDTYVANKRLIEGVLRHEKLVALMPIIFDDLAEVQRTQPAPQVDEENLDALVTEPPVTEPAIPEPVAGGDDDPAPGS